MSIRRDPQPQGEVATRTSRFAAFEVRNFRRYFIGQTISSVGSWTQALAVTWIVLDLTDRSDQLGIVMALQFLPMLLLGAPAGVLADKIDNRRLLIATSASSGLVALGFLAMIATGQTSMWAIYTLTTMLGLLLAVERPAMQAILFQLVGNDLLPSAVAANSTINSMSRLVGPALAGALIAGFDVGICFAVNAASYLVVIGALMRLRRCELIDRPLLGRTKGKLREGFAYVRNQPDVRRPLLVMVVVGTMALNFQTTFPSMVRFEFDLGAGSIGTAMSVSAIGSLLGGIYIAGVKPKSHRTLGIVLAGFAATLVALGLAPAYWAFVALSIPLGFASAAFQTVDTVALQRATEPAMQGRVMALQQMAWFGSTPIGALLMGWVIQISSPRVPFAVGGLATLASAAVIVLVRHADEPVEDIAVTQSGPPAAAPLAHGDIRPPIETCDVGRYARETVTSRLGRTRTRWRSWPRCLAKGPSLVVRAGDLLLCPPERRRTVRRCRSAATTPNDAEPNAAQLRDPTLPEALLDRQRRIGFFTSRRGRGTPREHARAESCPRPSTVRRARRASSEECW